MGLGRLNPGCNTCGCVPLPAPDGVCQEIGQTISPQSIRLDWRVWGFGNGILSDGCQTENGSPASYNANESSIDYTYPPYYDPNFACFDGVSIQSNSFISQFGSTKNAARFPVYQDTNKKYGLTNYYFPLITTAGCIGAFGGVGFSRDTFGEIWMGVAVSIGALVFRTEKYLATGFDPHPTTGVNWNLIQEFSAGNLTRSTWTETGSMLPRSSTLVMELRENNQVESWPWCESIQQATALVTVEQWTISSSYSIRLNDPSFGSMRTFPLWVPNPMPSYGSEFVQGASLTVSLGID